MRIKYNNTKNIYKKYAKWVQMGNENEGRS